MHSIRRKKRLVLLAIVVLSVGITGAATGGVVEGNVSIVDTSKVVVYLEGVAGTFPGQRAVMEQKNKTFIPYVLPIVKGTTVEFRNDDELTHNVFGVGAEEFDLGKWKKGVTREHTFETPGEVAILCNIHPEMEAYVLVLDNSYFARPGSDGRFRIADVPAGEYVARAWYRGKGKQATVKVPRSGTVTVGF